MPKYPLPSSLGRVVRNAGVAPGASTEISDTVGTVTGKAWWLISASIPLLKGGTGTPQPVLQISDGSGGTIGAWIGSSAAQAVNTTCVYTWSPDVTLTGQVGSGAQVFSNSGLPEMVLLPGWKIQTVTVGGIGATSNYSTASYLVFEIG